MKDLKETIPLMNSADTHEQFLAEYWQARIRYEKLSKTLTEYETRSLCGNPDGVPALLKRQCRAMQTYLEILSVRAAVESIDIGE